MSNIIKRSKERVKQTGEVFTPLELVDEILDELPQEVFDDPQKTFLDPSCGDGNFLVRVIAYKIEAGATVEQALSTTYGVDLMPDNIQHCKDRLLALADNYDTAVHGIKNVRAKYGHILEKNIVCADALKYHYRFDGSPPYDKTDEEKQEEHLSTLFE
jgi:predicted helicase